MLDEIKPDEVILAEADLDERAVLEVVEQAHRQGIKVRLAPDTTELLVQRGEYVPGQGAPLFELRPPVLTGWDWAVKRGFDLVVSLLVALVGLPIWALIVLAIKLDSRGPVFFVDRRIGVGEREFGMLKFRTMVADAAGLQPELEEENEAGGALFKIREDPRVTRVGRFLRRFSLDEIPQVANVLKGEMSLVGPRPLPLRDYQLLEDWHRRRYAVLPGMTGLWQISGRSGLTFDDLVRLDFTYIENWSIWLDISIIVKTIPAVVTRRGVLTRPRWPLLAVVRARGTAGRERRRALALLSRGVGLRGLDRLPTVRDRRTVARRRLVGDLALARPARRGPSLREPRAGTLQAGLDRSGTRAVARLRRSAGPRGAERLERAPRARVRRRNVPASRR